jgi:hypothetical protein
MTVVSKALLSTPASSSKARARIGSAKAGHLREYNGFWASVFRGRRHLLDAAAATSVLTSERQGDVSPARTCRRF